MALRSIDVFAEPGHLDTLSAIAEQRDCLIWRAEEGQEADDAKGVHAQPAHLTYVVKQEEVQDLLDAVQNLLGGEARWRATVIPVEATVPALEEPSDKDAGDQKKRKRNGFTGVTASREEIFMDVSRGARLDSTFVLLTALSAVVASVGLIADDVAIVIGAMVIAPLLGPNIAFAFGTATGDRDLMLRATATNVVGLGLTLALIGMAGAVWPDPIESGQVMSRTEPDFGHVLLALASGAAAVLSLTTGVSAALVGVMVSVALLPPAAVVGLMLGSGNYSDAGAAAVLLGVNVVCVNLAAQAVFVLKGIRPRTWREKKVSEQARLINAAMWIVLLALLLAAIWYLQATDKLAGAAGIG